MHFNLNHSLKQPEFDNIVCKIVETKVPISSELINDCKIQSSMNENQMNFQYLDVLDVQFLNSNFESKEALLDECKTHLCFEFISHAILSILYPYLCKTHNISFKLGFVGFLMESK